MLFFRPKDLIDIERMLSIQGAAFDRSFVRANIADMVGEDDARVTKWDEITERVPLS